MVSAFRVRGSPLRVLEIDLGFGVWVPGAGIGDRDSGSKRPPRTATRLRGFHSQIAESVELVLI